MEGNSFYFLFSEDYVELYIRDIFLEYHLIARIYTSERKKRWERLLQNVDWHKEDWSV